jgi:hypothetical protein
MEGYEQVIIVCYMKLEGPFSGFLFAVLWVCVCVCPSTCNIGTMIILFTRYLLNLLTQFFKKKTCWPHTSFTKTGSMPTTLYLSLKWIYACTLNIYWPMWVKFGTTDLHILPLEFCANLCSNSYTLLQHKI